MKVSAYIVIQYFVFIIVSTQQGVTKPTTRRWDKNNTNTLLKFPVYCPQKTLKVTIFIGPSYSTVLIFLTYPVRSNANKMLTKRKQLDLKLNSYEICIGFINIFEKQLNELRNYWEN